MFEIGDIENLTVNDVMKAKEGQFFDRKSADIKPKKLAETLIAFANADGGLAAIGIKDGRLMGINSQGQIKINDFIQAKIDLCQPPIRVKEKFLDITNVNGEEDFILLLQVDPSRDSVHKTNSDQVFLRVGDESKELTHEQRMDLQYDKGERLFEEQIINSCEIDDLEPDALEIYNGAVKYDGANLLRPLYARGYLIGLKKETKIIVAGVLLFAQNPTLFLPAARIRFIRYEGSSEEVGVEMNIVKQEYIEGPLPILIERAKEIVKAQLREFTALNPLNGKFTTIPEYPEFAWLEGIVNAVAHRAYNIQGDDIKIKMFDDRLEIISPGKFPNIVNRQNIKEVRYSRNPRIARALNEMGWVRELGEGVKRMFKEMDAYFLDEPEYFEGGNTVHLILRNNIHMRRIRRHERLNAIVSDEWKLLNKEERHALEYVYNRGKITTSQLEKVLDRSNNHSRRILEHLKKKEILELHRTSINDPNQYYALKETD